MRLQFRRSPPFGRLDLRFALNFVLQHPVMADDDDVDDVLPVFRRLRVLRRQDVVCPGMTREDVSILHATARSRTTSIDEMNVIGSRSSSTSTRDSSFFFFFVSSSSIVDVNEDRQFGLFFAGRWTSSSRRDDDPPPDRSSLHPHHRQPPLPLPPLVRRVQLPRFGPAYYY